MRRGGLASVLAALCLMAAADAFCAIRRSPYVGAIVAEANTGKIIFQDGADRPAYPASVTKLMTLLLVEEDVRAGKYAFDDKVVVTEAVNRHTCEASWIGLKKGDAITVRDLCRALMVESANDAAIALAVHADGTWTGFVDRMNVRAKALGMAGTTYYNPNGLPPNSTRCYPWKSFNVSTAADQLRLARQLLRYPETLEFTSIKTCDLVRTSGGCRISVTRRVGAAPCKTALSRGETLVGTLVNHNNIMVKDREKILSADGTECVDGLKTGYIEAGGSSIVLTAKRGKVRVIVVVLGSDKLLDSKGRMLKKGSEVRDEQAQRLAIDALSALAW